MFIIHKYICYLHSFVYGYEYYQSVSTPVYKSSELWLKASTSQSKHWIFVLNYVKRYPFYCGCFSEISRSHDLFTHFGVGTCRSCIENASSKDFRYSGASLCCALVLSLKKTSIDGAIQYLHLTLVIRSRIAERDRCEFPEASKSSEIHHF